MGIAMLAPGQRLRRSAEFAATIRGGRRAGRGVIVVHLSTRAASGDPAITRAGFVIPRSVGKAADRNRVRRRLRHLIRDELHALPPGSDVVIRVLPNASAASYRQLGRDLSAAIAAARSSRPRDPRKGTAV